MLHTNFPSYKYLYSQLQAGELENKRKENRRGKFDFSTLPTDFTNLKWSNFSRFKSLMWLQIHKLLNFKWRFSLSAPEFWTTTSIKNSVWNLKRIEDIFFFLVFLISCCSFSCVITSNIFDRPFLYILLSMYNHIKTYTISR